MLEKVDVAGRVRLRPRVRGPVRLTGAFLPLEPLLEAEGWQLETKLAVPAATLTGGPGVPAKLVSTSLLLSGLDGRLDDARGPFYVSLPTNQGAYHAVGSTAIAEGDVLRVSCDPASCRHVAG